MVSIIVSSPNYNNGIVSPVRTLPGSPRVFSSPHISKNTAFPEYQEQMNIELDETSPETDSLFLFELQNADFKFTEMCNF